MKESLLKSAAALQALFASVASAATGTAMSADAPLDLQPAKAAKQLAKNPIFLEHWEERMDDYERDSKFHRLINVS
ncbi:hypothetical protein TWF281_001436 [Arthrobotrys megalospora]